MQVKHRLGVGVVLGALALVGGAAGAKERRAVPRIGHRPGVGRRLAR